jgi:hypothetical protein
MEFAVIENNKVVNTIVADSKEIAESLTEKECVEYNENNLAHVGGDYSEGYFYIPQPFPSWTKENGQWISPTPKPEDDLENSIFYGWNEETLSWDELNIPQE